MTDSGTGGTRYREVEARSLTRPTGTVDAWFLGRYGMNLYRGCEHGCAYCDGRAERYYVTGDFERDIVIKRNAVAVLRRELARAREPGFVLLGGGVCDAYQPAEAKYGLARGVLELALERGFPVHVLTKSSLVERDFALLEAINRATRAIVSFSIATVDEAVRTRFEPRATPIAERLRLLRRAKELGLGVGAMAMPVLPGISDQPAHVTELVAACAEAGADFLLYGGLTLRPGVQKEKYLAVLAEHHPEHLAGYRAVYGRELPSGAPDPRYSARVEERFRVALGRQRLPARPPRALFTGQLPLYAEVAVLLEHREHERQLRRLPRAGLATAGAAIQAWARDELVRRRRGGNYREVEDELRRRLLDGSLAALRGVCWAAVAEARTLVGLD